MLTSFVSISVALAAVVGAWNLTKEALRRAEPPADS